MMYPFMTLDEDTEITHSEILPDGRVKIYIEQADEKDGFHYATCYLPGYTWENIFGFSDNEMQRFQKLVKNNARDIVIEKWLSTFDNLNYYC